MTGKSPVAIVDEEFPLRTMLVDGNNILARSDFAARGKQVAMSADGVNTAALVIFVNMISKHVRRWQPTSLAVMWDAGHDMRDAAYPGYKANRAKRIEGSEDTVPFAQAKEFLTWAGVPHKAHHGWEADDLIAATARQCIGDVAIVSGDKDLLQLLRPYDPLPLRGSVVQFKVPEDEPWTADRYEEKYGYPPRHAAMVHALVGDTSDGVPGLRGIGPKKAVGLLEEAGWSWEALLHLLGPEKAAVAATMRSLVDLRDLDYPDWFMAAHRGAPPFEPTALDGTMRGLALRDFLGKYRLKTLQDRLEAGTLWVGPEITPPSTEGVFDGLAY